MSALPEGVRSRTLQTSRLNVHTLSSGDPAGMPVVFVHGNVSSSRFFADFLAALPDEVFATAVDLRGFGETDAIPVDATRGVADFAADVRASLDALGVGSAARPAHLVGWSVGGGVLQRMVLDKAEGIASLTLLAPMSPFGFGGSKDVHGTPCFEDWAGTGGGTANPDFAARLASGDRSADSDTSPLSILRGFYVKPGLSVPSERESAWLDSMLSTRTGEGFYPGDMTPSSNWPTVAPGSRGMNNAISGKYCDTSAFGEVVQGPPVLWIRGADDSIVSDTSLFDFGFLGQIGAVPGWPGDEVFPPQPMNSQTRAMLDRYAQHGGAYTEVVLDDCGHSPHLEHPDRVRDLLLAHIGA